MVSGRHPTDSAPVRYDARQEVSMLSTLVVVLLVLWLLGMVSSYTIGGLIHILLVVAVVVLIERLLQGRRPMTG
jgi:hypothetical protein